MFPRTSVEGLSLPRMIIGTNWLMGWSHTGQAADQAIRERYATAESMYPVFQAFLEHGADAVMGPISQSPLLLDAIQYAQDRSGQAITMIDTPMLDMSDSAEGRRAAQEIITQSAKAGSALCMIHHSSIEQLVNRRLAVIERIDDYTQMIREAGMIPGATAHMPEVVLYADKNGYDLQAYVQIYNCLGFLMQVEVEQVASIIQNAKKPVMAIKAMAAGRCTPYVGLTFAWNCLRPQDMVVVGCNTPGEVHEDAEISLAAIEHRFPAMKKRASPNTKQAVLQ